MTPQRERANLTDRAVAGLRPRAREYTVWDSRLVGLGVRVRPTGGRSYVLLHYAAGRSRRVSLGPVTTKGIAEARRECHARMTDPEAAGAVPARAVPLFRDFVAGEWKEARFERCKPSTKKGVVSVLEGQLLPAFGSKPLDRIALVRIRRWFDDFSRTAPGNANHALDLLRRIMNFAIACGHVDTNPAREVKPNPRPTLTVLDTDLQGFGFKVSPKGRETFFVRAAPKHGMAETVLGTDDELTATQAGEKAAAAIAAAMGYRAESPPLPHEADRAGDEGTPWDRPTGNGDRRERDRGHGLSARSVPPHPAGARSGPRGGAAAPDGGRAGPQASRERSLTSHAKTVMLPGRLRLQAARQSAVHGRICGRGHWRKSKCT